AGVGAWRLEVAASPTGTITSTPAGIDCGATCSGLFVGPVTLAFAPVPGPTFVSWSVPGCSGLTCAIPASPQGVTATVEALPAHEVTVTRAGTGQGRVVSTPVGIGCGTECTALLPDAVTLNATAEPGSAFTGWSDPTCGSSSRCYLPGGSAPVTIAARFDLMPSRVINVVVSGSAPGEVVAFQNDAVVGRCQGSCSMLVPSAGYTVVGFDTPYEYGPPPITGPGCYSPHNDRCFLNAGSTEASFAATFSFGEKDDWTYFGEPGERFATGAFDIANHLIASSQRRMVKFDGTGQVLWTLPPADRILAGPGTEFYTWTAAGGTVKRSSEGAALWTFAGELEAVDRVSGNILVHPSTTTMALLLPTGAPLWTMPGQGTDLDSAGIVYEPYTYTRTDPSTYDTEGFLTARRYSAAGVPIGELTNVCISSDFIDALESDFEVSGDRFACELSAETQMNRGSVDFAMFPTSGPPPILKFLRRRESPERPRTRLAAASDGTLGMVHNPVGLDPSRYFGFLLTRVARDGTQSIVTRYPSYADNSEGHGTFSFELAGGATDRFAVLGSYRPIVSYTSLANGYAHTTESGPVRGIIQVFKP
ncbi:MAG: hypothetical protein H7269_02740, partial [Cellulomonas sp.]|nr:hypothetical protein [Cellulomonas sp.]